MAENISFIHIIGELSCLYVGVDPQKKEKKRAMREYRNRKGTKKRFTIRTANNVRK